MTWKEGSRTELIATEPKMHVTTGDLALLVEELRASHAVYSPLFRRREQRAWASTSLHGVLSEVPRKSIEPMVRAVEGVHPKAVRAMHAFISAGAWDDETLLHRHWQEVARALRTEDGVLMGDGSDVPKQGEHAVGVKRQDCGELGKRAHGHAGVLLG
jgi:SRSO17 transposase